MNAHWQSWFALGVLRFRLNPDAFWGMSFLEWRALCVALGSSVARPPDRRALGVLMKRFPDGGVNDRQV